MFLEDDSISKLVNSLIDRAIAMGASDIHLEHENDGLRVRYRIDGVLQDQPRVHQKIMLQISGRVKVLAKLDLSERRIPQDGKIRHLFENQVIDLRVSTFPAIFGEKFVIRILDQKRLNINLRELGMPDHMLESLERVIRKSQGFILVTGPTGSGKTTTLYAILKELHSPNRNIITLEDPVEYLIAGVTQGQIYPRAGFSFAKGIRALLRQDPDIAMIGEIRDPETARIGVEAALTGHLVLSTLHTNDAPGAIARLMDMGIEPFLLNASISAVIAQRLVRKLCEECKVESKPNAQDLAILNELKFACEKIFKPRGCQACNQIGFSGRLGIFEYLEMNNNLRELIICEPRLSKIYELALGQGMTTIRQDALAKIESGITSLDEILRVI